MRTAKLLSGVLSLAALTMALGARAVTPDKIVIPSPKGYISLVGDFHTHTAFTDATLWPNSLVEEAYLEGLDFISVTDHVEPRTQHQKKKMDGKFFGDQDESWKIALNAAKGKNLIVIHGGEITRSMPPGHFNMHWVSSNVEIAEIETAAEAKAKEGMKNPDKMTDKQLAKVEFAAAEAALRAAKAQGAFTTWNHPNWENQAPNVTKMWPEHKKLFKAGLVDGIEVFNGFRGQATYCPEAHRWAIERDMAILSGTDCHYPLFLSIDYVNGEHRPVTIVFAKERSEAAIRSALDERLSCIFGDGAVYGSKKTLPMLLDACLDVKVKSISAKSMTLTVVNRSSIPVSISKIGTKNLRCSREFTIDPFDEIEISFTQIAGESTVYDINYEVTNWFTNAGETLKWNLHYEK